ncbi:MAG TPA: YibE/F family protein [Candidatus Paceibacterota bacterium]|jgi:uncharacterized membrane protein|nr:YibE/F family protein [Candidatus Paceibacterota bacterium]
MKSKAFKGFLAISILLSAAWMVPHFAAAQESGTVVPDTVEVVKARVIDIQKEEEQVIPGTDTPGLFQTIEAEILEGSQKGKIVTFTDDYLHLQKGDIFYLNHTVQTMDGIETYAEMDAYRMPTIYLFGGMFVLLVLLIGGMQGLRGLASLTGSLLLIFFVLIPGIIGGLSPVLVSVVVSAVIIIVGSYITHGFNKTTSSAVVGMIITVLFTGALAYWAVHMGRLTGYGTDESVYVTLNSRGKIDILGVLLGGMMIGFLGILYDVAIGQAISVEELHHIAPHVEKKRIYSRALRIGREHIGALVNTLAIAYVGASLPLLIVYAQSSTPISQIANREVFATEIIRTFVGSIGLVLAVPITTFLAVMILVKRRGAADKEIIHEEREALKHYEHHH